MCRLLPNRFPPVVAPHYFARRGTATWWLTTARDMSALHSPQGASYMSTMAMPSSSQLIHYSRCCQCWGAVFKEPYLTTSIDGNCECNGSVVLWNVLKRGKNTTQSSRTRIWESLSFDSSAQFLEESSPEKLCFACLVFDPLLSQLVFWEQRVALRKVGLQFVSERWHW